LSEEWKKKRGVRTALRGTALGPWPPTEKGKGGGKEYGKEGGKEDPATAGFLHPYSELNVQLLRNPGKGKGRGREKKASVESEKKRGRGKGLLVVGLGDSPVL